MISNAHKLKTSFGIIGADLSLLNVLEGISLKDPHETQILTSFTQLKGQMEEIYFALKI